MIPDSATTVAAERRPVSFGMGMFPFIILLTVIFFLLAQSMVRHRFHEGGRIDSNGSMGQ